MVKSDNRILIVTGGQIEEDLLQNRVEEANYTMMIAADHGLTVADRLKLPLDFIVGDFDSVSEKLLSKYKELSTPINTFPKEKDKTDTEIAMELALMHNPTVIELFGATGNRMDHVLANIHLLLLPMQLNVEACLLDKNNKIYLKNKGFTLSKEKQYGSFVSLLPFTDKVNGLTLKGFRYPLNDITLLPGTSLGISNEIVSAEAVVEFSDGILIVIESKD